MYDSMDLVQLQPIVDVKFQVEVVGDIVDIVEMNR